MHKIGAIFYILWGILHLLGAANGFRLAGVLDPGLIQGKLLQHAWNTGLFGAFGLTVAILLNWKNSRTGYWLNLLVLGVTDLGYVLFVVLPGYVSPVEGWSGPVLWLLGAVFTTLGVRTADRAATPG
jgi:hypothetical protein